jgi:hypothetical protein
MLAQGLLPFQIIEFMGGPYRSRQTPHQVVANARMAALGQPHLVASPQFPRQAPQPPAQASSFIQPSIERPTEPEPRVRADSSTWRRIEPKPTGPSVLKYEVTPGTYTLMQQRFDQGDLARTTEQQHQLYMMPREGALSALQTSPNMQDVNSIVQSPMTTAETVADGKNSVNVDDKEKTKAQKTGKKKLKLTTRTEKETTPGGTINQGPRCAKCIKSHKRCTHRESPASNLPLGSSPLSSPFHDYVFSAVVPEGYSPAPMVMPDQPLTLPATSVEMPVQAAAKKATPKRKR